MSATPKILLTSYSGRYAGMEHRVVEEAAFLKKTGVPVVAATREFPERAFFKDALQDVGVNLLKFSPPPFLSDWRWRHLHRIRAAFAARSWLHAKAFTLVRVFMPWSNRGLEHIWLASRAGIPVVVSAHNTFDITPITTGWHTSHLHQAFRAVRAVFGNSEPVLTSFQHKFSCFLQPGTLNRVIPNAVDTAKFAPSNKARTALRQQLGLSDSTPIIGSVGRLSKHKQPLLLVTAFRIISRARPDAHFVLIGEGELRAEAERAIAEYGMRNMVTLMGQQSEMHTLMPGLDVHIQMSLAEGFSNVTAEAMASGVPVVVSDIPASHAVVGDEAHGKIIPRDQPNEAANAVIWLLNNPVMAADIAIQARARINRHFGPTAKEQALARLYNEVL